MGVYVYKITRKARNISGRKIHEAEYAYKCGGSMYDTDSKGRTYEERMHSKFVEPTARAWANAEIMKGESIKDALFVCDYEDGAEVMLRSSVSFYDTGEFGEVVGHLRSNGRTFRYIPNRPQQYKVTFKGSTNYNTNEKYSDVFAYVTAINETRAKIAAMNNIDAANAAINVYCTTYERSRGVMVEKVEKVNIDAATKAA